jgi:hypothetical protein
MEVIRVVEKRILIEAKGLKLEGMLADSPGDKGVVISHPHPLYGGTMHNNVVKAVAHAYQEEEYSTLRFNFRGVEKSEGSFGNGEEEQEEERGDGRQDRSGLADAVRGDGHEEAGHGIEESLHRVPL